MTKVESADRALQMLQAFAYRGQGLTASALAVKLGVHRSNATRLAATLVERGFLERASGGETFRLGPEVARLGVIALAAR